MLRIGLFADVHYARGLTIGSRACGQALGRLRQALCDMADCDLMVNLGDLVNAAGDRERDLENLGEALAVLRGSTAPVHSLVGNHDAEVAPKSAFVTADPCGAYQICAGEITLIMLDGCFTSACEDYARAAWDWTDSSIPDAQRIWLRDRLSECEGDAVVFCHQNLDERRGPDGRMDPHVVRNAAAVRDVLEAAGNVRAVFQGHCHRGCQQVIAGIPYYTLSALCEGEGAPHAIAQIDGRRVSVRGIGMPDAEYRREDIR